MASKWSNVVRDGPHTKPKLKQEEFDEAVNTNIEDFDMQVCGSYERLPLSHAPLTLLHVNA